MLLDLENPDIPRQLDADLCIIGSGAAGIAMARRLMGTGVDVLVLEAGGLAYDTDSQQIYNGMVKGVGYPVASSRLRFFGGTTNHWEGWCGMLRPVDFTARSWVPGSGWPITFDTLEPYYRSACQFLELGPFDFDTRVGKPPAKSTTPRGAPYFDSFNIRPSPVPRLAITHKEPLTKAPNIRILLHANVLPIAAEAGAVRQITVSTLDHRTATVRAKAFVLACGGLENARLLLASGNLANSSDRLGRCFMDHMFSTFAGVVVPPPDLEEPVAYAGRLGLPPFVGLRTSPAAQEELGLLACSVGVNPAPIPDSLKPPGPRGIRTAFPILIHGECTARAESRITLTPEFKDRFGVPRLALNWVVDDLTQRSVRETVLRYAAMLTRAGLGRTYVPPEKSELDWPFALYPPCHPAGTTRMSADPGQGVVDANCRTHDISNLYVVGGSVFPTIGHMNPTMTIIAMAFRLADHLQSVLATR